MKTNRYSVLAALSFASATVLAVVVVYIVVQPMFVPPSPKQKIPTPEELGFYESGPGPHLFTDYAVFDSAYMVKTECDVWNGNAVVLRPDTTVPIKLRILSRAWYDLNVTVTAKLNPMLDKGVPGVTLWFDKPWIILPAGKEVDVNLFLRASKDVKDTTTILVFHINALAVPNPRYGMSNQGDVLYVMIGENPNLPHPFAFYPSVKVNGTYLYEAGEKPDRMFLSITRGQTLNITVLIHVKSNASYPINFTTTDPYLLPDKGVTAQMSPRWAIARAGETIEFIITVSVGKDFVGLRKDYWPADQPMHGKDLYMLTRITDQDQAADNGWCRAMNLPFGLGPDAYFFEVKDE